MEPKQTRAELLLSHILTLLFANVSYNTEEEFLEELKDKCDITDEEYYAVTTGKSITQQRNESSSTRQEFKRWQN